MNAISTLFEIVARMLGMAELACYGDDFLFPVAGIECCKIITYILIAVLLRLAVKGVIKRVNKAHDN